MSMRDTIRNNKDFPLYALAATLLLGVLYGALFHDPPPVFGQTLTRLYGTHPSTGVPIPLTASNGMLTACDQQSVISGNTAATAQLAALSAGRQVVVCGVLFTGGGATTAKLVRGTGTNCGTNQADMTGPLELGDNVPIEYYGTLRTAVGEALCWTNSGAVQVSGVVSWGYQGP